MDTVAEVALAATDAAQPRCVGTARLQARIADALAPMTDQVWTIVLSSDVAGLVGSMLKNEHKVAQEVIVVDGINVGEFNFIDLGEQLESVEAIPVVVKSLVFEG